MLIRAPFNSTADTGLPVDVNINERIAGLDNIVCDWLIGAVNPAVVTLASGKIASIANMISGGPSLLAHDATDRALYADDYVAQCLAANFEAATTGDPIVYKWDSGHATQPSFSAAHSIVVFFRKPDADLVNGSYTLAGSYNSNASSSYMYLDETGNGLRADFGDGLAVVPDTLDVGEWHCAIMAWNGTNAVKASFDFGTFVSATVTTPGSPTGQFCVGGRTTAGTNPFMGWIKRVLFFNADISGETADGEALDVLEEYFTGRLAGTSLA